MKLALPLSLLFLFFAVNIYCNNNNIGKEEGLLNLIATDQTLDLAPINEITVGHERQCISLCYYNKRCSAYDITEIEPRHHECRMFDVTYDHYKNNDGRSLVAKTGAVLHSKHFTKQSCMSWYRSGARVDGVYKVEIRVGMFRQVYCIMESYGGGWMAFSRRYNGSVIFKGRMWKNYKNGFGEATGEYWLGNDILHLVTQSMKHELMVHAESFDVGEICSAKLRNFRIGAESVSFEMDHDGQVPGSGCGIPFLRFRPRKFSTNYKDNDFKDNDNCAAGMGSGWWYNACSNDQMNGHYYTPAEWNLMDNSPPYRGIYWGKWLRATNTSQRVLIKKVNLMVRPEGY